MAIEHNYDQLKFPIGKHQAPNTYSSDQRNEWIHVINELPNKLIQITKDLKKDELEYTYRPLGWSIQQVIHHFADSHMNSFIRFKLSLTEDTPTIKPYNEASWAEMNDYKQVPIEFSLSILHGVHARWTSLMKDMNESDYHKAFNHPETGMNMSLNEACSMYAWHSKHHFAHVENALSRKLKD